MLVYVPERCTKLLNLSLSLSLCLSLSLLSFSLKYRIESIIHIYWEIMTDNQINWNTSHYILICTENYWVFRIEMDYDGNAIILMDRRWKSHYDIVTFIVLRNFWALNDMISVYFVSKFGHLKILVYA